MLKPAANVWNIEITGGIESCPPGFLPLPVRLYFLYSYSFKSEKTMLLFCHQSVIPKGFLHEPAELNNFLIY